MTGGFGLEASATTVLPWELELSQEGLTFSHPVLPIRLARSRGELSYRRGAREFREQLDLRCVPVAGNEARYAWMARGAHLDLRLTLQTQNYLRLGGVLQNRSGQDVALGQLRWVVDDMRLGASAGRCSFFKNGYQSWTETRSFSAQEREMLPRLRVFSQQQDNVRNLSSGRPGEFASDMFSVLGNVEEGVFLLLGQVGDFRQLFNIRVWLADSQDQPKRLEVVYDFGGKVLSPAGAVELDPVVVLADSHANRIQDTYFDLVALPNVRSLPRPTGWCSWYYYYARVTAQDLDENLHALRAQQVDWRFFVLDDGYESAVGDWLSPNARFPGGLEQVAARIRASGLLPGIWIAPFVARSNSRLFREHPQWLLRDGQGRPALAGWNPIWGLEGRFYGLDTTHPDFQERLREWIQTIVHAWGYRYLKLDFTYGAALDGQAHDRSWSAAERLQLGYRLIREAAGPEVFILGCGSPLSPAVGWVDALRIGPDVAPYWFARYRYGLMRDPHALCTKFAIRNALNRCQMHRRLWVNDPDCLLLRDTETKLTQDERLSLVHAVVITGGMYVLSDRLARLAGPTWKWMEEIEALVQANDGGRPWALDYMEREIPEAVYNSAGYLAVFNFADGTVAKRVPLDKYLHGIVDRSARWQDVWSGGHLASKDGLLDLGPLKPHASRLLRLIR